VGLRLRLVDSFANAVDRTVVGEWYSVHRVNNVQGNEFLGTVAMCGKTRSLLLFILLASACKLRPLRLCSMMEHGGDRLLRSPAIRFRADDSPNANRR
jgi:hypothetical protein